MTQAPLNNPFFRAFESLKYGHLLLMVNCDQEGNDVLQLFANPPSIGVCHLEIPLEAGLTTQQIYQDFVLAMTIEEAEELAEEIFDIDQDIDFN